MIRFSLNPGVRLARAPLAFRRTTRIVSTMSYSSSATSSDVHPLLAAFRSQKTAYGAWVMLPGALHARLVAQSSEDLSWLVIDCEHGMTSLQPGAAESILAIETSGGRGKSGPTALVRIPATGRDVEQGAGWQIKYALDAGARGVVVPMVSTASQARAVAAQARFPTSVETSSQGPTAFSGIRGFGSTVPQSTWNVSSSSYLKSANDEIIVIIQIETQEAVKNVEEIMAVDGIDGFFIDIEEVIQKIKKVGQKAGKKCAIFCTNGEQAAKRREEGWDMISVMIDYSAMQENLAHNLAIAVGKSA